MVGRVVGSRQAGVRRNGAVNERRPFRSGYRLPQVLNSYRVQTVAVVKIDQHDMPYDVRQIQMNNRLIGGGERKVTSAPKPRLRWSRELHDAFVKACNQLGGANKATPKALMNLLKADGVSLHHLKSHLQKFRMGRIGRRLWNAEHYYAGFEQVAMDGDVSSASNRSDGTGSTHECLIKTYAGDSSEEEACFRSEVAEEKMKADPSEKMTLPFVEGHGEIDPIFSPVPLSEIDGTHLDWSVLLDGGGRQPAFPCPVVDDQLMEDYLKSLDKSSESALPTSSESGGSLSKID